MDIPEKSDTDENAERQNARTARIAKPPIVHRWIRGADLVALYTGFVYEGPFLARRLAVVEHPVLRAAESAGQPTGHGAGAAAEVVHHDRATVWQAVAEQLYELT